MIDRRGLTLVGIAVANLDDDGPSSSRCRSIPAATARSTPRSTRSATASDPARSPAPCCSDATQGLIVPLLPD